MILVVFWPNVLSEIKNNFGDREMEQEFGDEKNCEENGDIKSVHNILVILKMQQNTPTPI